MDVSMIVARTLDQYAPMELKWTPDVFDGSWIGQGERRRYRLFARLDGWCAVCHSWSASWPRGDSQPVNVQVLATGVSLDEAKARCREHLNDMPY
jgi:hypothetical protein